MYADHIMKGQIHRIIRALHRQILAGLNFDSLYDKPLFKLTHQVNVNAKL